MVLATSALMALGLVAAILVLISSLGSLPELRRRYPETPTDVPMMSVGSLRMGLASYNNCVRLALTADGLFLRWGFPLAWRRQVLRIPLADLHDPTVKRTWVGTSWVTCTVGDGRLAMTLPLWLFTRSEAGRALIGQAARP
jgi:hypothetical protein